MLLIYFVKVLQILNPTILVKCILTKNDYNICFGLSAAEFTCRKLVNRCFGKECMQCCLNTSCDIKTQGKQNRSIPMYLWIKVTFFDMFFDNFIIREKKMSKMETVFAWQSLIFDMKLLFCNINYSLLEYF